MQNFCFHGLFVFFSLGVGFYRHELYPFKDEELRECAKVS